MSKKSEYLRALVTERLSAAAEEIFALVETTIAEYEEELRRSKEENQRNLQLLDSVRNAQAELQKPDVAAPLSCSDQRSSGLSGASAQKQRAVKSERDAPEETGENCDDWTAPSAGPSEIRDQKADPDGQSEEQSDEQSEEQMEEEQTAAPEPHQCCICDQMFVDPQSLKRHMDLHMEEVELLSRTRAAAAEEEDEEEEDEEDTCKRRAPQPRPHALSRTVASFGGSPFSCPFCKRDFARKSDLQYHILIHTGEKPFSCSQCNRRFNRKSNLYRHYRNHAKKKIL
ncbi:histone-lysine N-methyltransferase MECOM-like isoform X2 [Boleophthalmus pectinirostris]|uniref:histone-lysine N-methyltransferase MECOM-like isoform X2 n=1 Tax=Boleophthalmus pectinirostris TaxID=150288 RepID=UPI00243088A1|nr:histone-lysine N-methyltransferase MECOM-like isoform X2 [Boleophthalmus pectinirostris]